MRILLDHCVPRQLRAHLRGHDVRTAYEERWAALKNGGLLDAAQAAGFDALVTSDQNLRFQQNMTGRRIAVFVLAARTNRLADLMQLVPTALTALETLHPGQVIRIEQPPAAEGTA